MWPRREPDVEIKTPEQLALMREAGLVVARTTLRTVAGAVRPGACARTLGGAETVLHDDGWTVTTADGSWAAHFERTVAITAPGPWVLTAEDGGQDQLSDT